VNVFSRWRRSGTALAVAAAVVPLAIAAASPASASAAPVRTATTTSYNNTTFLQDDLGFPTTDTNPVVQPVTYDEFQWLLQQSGSSAFLIGDPAEDTNFKAEAKAVEAEAETDGVQTIYWFDPNLSGGNGGSTGTTLTPAQGSAIHEPNLDIRNPAGITSLSTASQLVYGNAWLNVVGQYLGNGVTATATGVNTEEATVTAVTGTGTVNNYGGYSTEIANGAANTSASAPYDYSLDTGYPATLPGGVSDSYFFIYNKADTVSVAGTPEPEKIVSWVDLDTEYATPAQIAPDVDAVIAAVPGAASLAAAASSLTAYTQFNWWESEATAKENQLANNSPALATQPNADGGDIPLLTAADGSASAGGWRVDQITYPELVDLLKSGANTSNAVILFGGTWCPNTRPVIPFINQYAQQNNVTTVFNFDTVLDGGTVGGNTTGTGNPLQSRNSVSLSTNLDGAGGTSESAQNNPTFLYGDLVSTYLKNINTQYTGGSDVTYYPGGVTSLTGSVAGSTATPPVQAINKLQVPFLIGYQANDGGGVTRQWIVNHGNDSFTEYMSDWWYTNPQPGELGLSIPAAAPIWSTINSDLANLTWQTDPSTLAVNSAIDTDDANYLVSGDYATVKYTAATTTPTVKAATVTTASANSTATGAIPIDPASLSTALAALPGENASVPVNLAAAKTQLIAAEVLEAATPTAQTAAQITTLDTVVGAWGVAQTRKTSVNNVWGSATNVTGVLGGLAADNALGVFFGGLPGGVVSTQTVTANAVNYGKALQISVAIANQFGRVPTGNVSLVVQSGSATLASTTAPVVNDVASFTVPISGAGTYSYVVSYQGDDQIVSFDQTGSLTVPADPAATTPVTVTPTPTPVTPAVASRIKVEKLAGSVSKAPTSRTAGKYKVKITAASGKSEATGKVTIKLRKGAATKTITARLSRGSVTFTVPKLTPGTWRVAISWAGDATYRAASGTGASIKVAAAKIAKKK
jgi:hypothetical protein